MGTSELFTGPGTSDRMKKVAESLPPYDLLKAYREAAQHFKTTDIVLIVVPDEKQLEGFNAMPRSVYVEQAFRRWDARQRAVHPLTQNSAHKHLKLPVERPAFWLAVESPKDGAIGHVAIGAIFRPSFDQVADPS